MDGFNDCTSYLQHTSPTSLSSVWSCIAWKTAVYTALLIQKTAEVPLNLVIESPVQSSPVQLMGPQSYHWKITEKFSTTNFLPDFLKFLQHNLPGTTRTPTYHNCFDAYKQLIISLPSNRFLGERVLIDRVQIAPSVGSSFGKSRSFQHCIHCGGLTFIQVWRGIIRWVFLQIFI